MTKTVSKKKRGLSHRRALVTGASVGIGAAFAERLARDRHNLILVARDSRRLQALAQRLHESYGVTATVLPADLTQAAELRTVEETITGNGALDLLVNSAGFGTMGRFVELDSDREEQEIQLNVVALVRLTRAALPGMVARRHGAIVNVSSLAALQPGPCNATYCATKAYVNSFTEALHEELRGTGVRVQALCPGFTRTEFQQRAGIDVSDIPSFAWMTAEEVVDASLTGLQRNDVICVPGLVNRAVATLVGVIPRPVTRRILGLAARRRAR